MILICVNELAGPTGYHKSVVQTTNALHRAGYPVAVLSFLGGADGSSRATSTWPLDPEVPAFALQTLPAAGGSLLHRNYHATLTGSLGTTRFGFTANQLAALRQLNAALTEDDTVIFTAPIPAYAFHHALGDETRRVKTVLQIHNDYQFHEGLWNMLMDARGSIDRLQTVSNGLRPQFFPEFDEDDVVFIPNLPGDNAGDVPQAEHDGINIVLPASFQGRKNQLDAVRALALIDDESVRLTLWGGINRLNPYFIAVQRLAAQLDLGERVQFPGFGSEPDIYSTADIVVMTSLSEGFGYPLIEAASHRLPAVSYDFEFGPRDVIEHGGSGYIVPVGDVERLADKLARLAADERLRACLGQRAREIFAERFSAEAVTEAYCQFLGPTGRRIDLVSVFATDGTEPIAIGAISHGARRVGGRLLHQVTVRSSIELHEVQIDNGNRVEAPMVRRSGGVTRIRFSAAGNEVVSYRTSGPEDRHYLANINGGTFEVLPYLRRDANLGDGVPAVVDTIFAVTGGARRADARELIAAFAPIVKNAPRDVLWKLRHLSAPSKHVATPAATLSEIGTARIVQKSPLVEVGARLARVSRQLSGLFRTAGALAVAAAKRATTLAILRLATNQPAPTRREIARHPLFPVTSGKDNFGTPINRPGGVAVRNAGSLRRPTVSINGEYDWLLLRDGSGQRTIRPPFDYGEFFEGICAAERDYGLFDITTPDGVHVWELGRSALVIQLAEAAGFWGKHHALGATVNDVYEGPKRLTKAPRARRVVFDYARRGQSDYRTAAYRGDETMFIVQPEPNGYPEVDDTNLVYPINEFNEWRQSWRRRWAQLRGPEVDARPFEEALSKTLGIRVDLGTHLRSRMLKYLDEREFWTPVFERVKPEEVMIASSHWLPGIADAAARSGAQVSDIQYALTNRFAPSFWFGGTPHYGATRFYAWSDYWAARTNVYQEHVVVPRQQPEFMAATRDASSEEVWDVCVIAQPRIFRRMLGFLQNLTVERPELKVVIAPHPSQRFTMAGEIAAANLAEKVAVAPADTLSAIKKSRMCVGAFSTSMWEAVALGRPTYVIPVPGFEQTLDDIASGLFRLATSPQDLVPFDIPETHRTIFGHA